MMNPDLKSRAQAKVEAIPDEPLRDSASLARDPVYSDPDTKKKVKKLMEARELPRDEYVKNLLRVIPELDESFSALLEFLGPDRISVPGRSEVALQGALEKPVLRLASEMLSSLPLQNATQEIARTGQDLSTLVTPGLTSLADLNGSYRYDKTQLLKDVVYTDPYTPAEVMQKMERRELTRAEYVTQLRRIAPEQFQDDQAVEEYFAADRPTLEPKTSAALMAVLAGPPLGDTVAELLARTGLKPRFTPREEILREDLLEALEIQRAAAKEAEMPPAADAGTSAEIEAVQVERVIEAEDLQGVNSDSPSESVGRAAAAPARTGKSSGQSKSRQIRPVGRVQSISRSGKSITPGESKKGGAGITVSDLTHLNDKTFLESIVASFSPSASTGRRKSWNRTTIDNCISELERRVPRSDNPEIFIPTMIAFAVAESERFATEGRERLDNLTIAAAVRSPVAFDAVLRRSSGGTGNAHRLAARCLFEASKQLTENKDARDRFLSCLTGSLAGELPQKLRQFTEDLHFRHGLFDAIGDGRECKKVIELFTNQLNSRI